MHFCPPRDPLVNCWRKHLEPKRKVFLKYPDKVQFTHKIWRKSILWPIWVMRILGRQPLKFPFGLICWFSIFRVHVSLVSLSSRWGAMTQIWYLFGLAWLVIEEIGLIPLSYILWLFLKGRSYRLNTCSTEVNLMVIRIYWPHCVDLFRHPRLLWWRCL